MSIYITDTADVLRAAGVTVIEVPGWKTRGSTYRGGQRALNGIIDHHTATKDHHPGDMPTLSWLVKGGANLPGPVSNTGLGRSGTWYMVAAGRANHAGPVYAEHRTTYGNGYSHGVEAENSGVSGPWPDVQYESYARGTAAMSVYYGIPFTAHKIVRPGKVDPSFPWEPFVAEVERHARVLRAHGFAKGKLPAEPVSLTATEEAASKWTTPEGDDPAYLHMGHLHPKVAEIQTWATKKWSWARAILDTYGADQKFGRNTRTLVATLQERLNSQAARDKWSGWTPLEVDGKWGPATEAAATSKSGFRKDEKEEPSVVATPITPLPVAKSKAEIKGIAFGLRLEKVALAMGFTVTCGPSAQKAGLCTPQSHPHSDTSWHFKPYRGEVGWALDVSRNYGGPVSKREIAYLSAWVYIVQAAYGHLGMDSRLNVKPGDHDDHAHNQPEPHITKETIFLDFSGAPEGILLPGMGTRLGNRFRQEEVRVLQESLGVKPDGAFGLDTFNALREKQAKAGLTPDGIAGAASFEMLGVTR